MTSRVATRYVVEYRHTGTTRGWESHRGYTKLNRALEVMTELANNGPSTEAIYHVRSGEPGTEFYTIHASR
jgi:hypothetical protein